MLIKFANMYGLLLLALAAAGFLAWRFFLSGARDDLESRSAHREVLLKGIALALLCLACSDPYFERTKLVSDIAVVVDISDSMDEAKGEELLKKALAYREGEARLSVVPFAKTPSPSGLLADEVGGFAKLKRAWSKLDIGQTNLERALTDSPASESATVLLVSDGFETRGDSRKTLEDLSSFNGRIFPIVPDDPSASDKYFKISNFYAPLIAPAQRSVEARVSISNTTNEKQTGILEITHDKKVILSKEVEVAAGKDLLVTAESDPSQEGIKELVATLKPSRGGAASTETIFLSGETREKVLLVSGGEEDERVLAEILRSQAYQLKSQVSSGKELELPEFSDYSVVIFNNVPSQVLPRGTASKLDAYVKNGGGFVMIGGDRSFGLGGYRNTPYEEILPVEMAPPQTVKKRLNVALELVLDKSRSMSFNEKLDLSKEAARELIRNMKDEDLIGVIGFDAVPFEVVKLAPLASNREQASEGVGRLYPAGKTNLFPAMDEARRRLDAVNAGRKHMLILTDGQLPDEGPIYVQLVKQLRVSGISVSTVLLGDEDFSFLKSLAEIGGGSFYQTSDARALPRIFLSDVKVSSGEQTMKETEEFLVRAGPASSKSTDIETFPPVRGYVQTEAKRDANLELVAYAEGKAEPLLASWKYGKGKSAAFMSDANGRWSSYWVKWPRFQKFWTDILNSLRAEDAGAGEAVKFDLRYHVEHGALVLDLSLFSEEAARNVGGVLKFPDGTEKPASFEALGPGHYQAIVPEIIAGKYEFRGLSNQRKLTPVAFNLPGELFGEKKGQGFNLPLLISLAEATRGKVNPGKEDIISNPVKKIVRTDLSVFLLVAAGLLVCLEILRREVWGGNPFRMRFASQRAK